MSLIIQASYGYLSIQHSFLQVCTSVTSHVDGEPRKLPSLLDVFLGTLVLIVGETSVDALEVELNSQVSVL